MNYAHNNQLLMSQTNKNKGGINTYLASQKLFHKQSSHKKNGSLVVNNPTVHQPNSHSQHKYKYSILKDLKKDQPSYSRSIHKDKLQELSQVAERTQNGDKKPERQDSPIRHEASIRGSNKYSNKDQIVWESQIVKSSRKYFASCRGQAYDYIAKLENTLYSDHALIQKTIEEIRQYMQESYYQQAQKIKEDLYLAVDEAVQRWRTQELKKSQMHEINYIGELLELGTQIEERLKQMQSYRRQLEDERIWRQRASDLLTTSYEEDILELTKLCQKSVVYSKHQAEKLSTLKSNAITNKLMEIGKQNLHLRIKKCTLDQIFEVRTQHKKTEPNLEYGNRHMNKKDTMSTSRKNPSICESCSLRLRTESDRRRKF